MGASAAVCACGAVDCAACLPTARQSQALDVSHSSLPSPVCELCGLGLWLHGLGVVPGVHWVQLWRVFNVKSRYF